MSLIYVMCPSLTIRRLKQRSLCARLLEKHHVKMPAKCSTVSMGQLTRSIALRGYGASLQESEMSLFPPPPKTAEEAAEVIGRSIYAPYLQAEVKFEQELALIWFHPQLNSILMEHGEMQEVTQETHQEVSCDATFKCVPNIFGGRQKKQHWTMFLLCGSNFLPMIQVRFNPYRHSL